MNRQDLIKKLQEPKQFLFGWLEKEEQELIEELYPKGHVQYLCWPDCKTWEPKDTSEPLMGDSIYRIDPAYSEPKPVEYEYFEVFKDDRKRLSVQIYQSTYWINVLTDFVNFETLEVKKGDGWYPITIEQARYEARAENQLRAKFVKE